MVTSSAHRRFSESDWVNSTIAADLSEPPKPKLTEQRFTLRDSKEELEQGLDISELDTIPAELLEFFQR